MDKNLRITLNWVVSKVLYFPCLNMAARPSATSSSPPPLSFLLLLILLFLILVLVFLIFLLFLLYTLSFFLFSFLFLIGLSYSGIFIVKRSARLRRVNIALKNDVIGVIWRQLHHNCSNYINPLFPGRQIYVLCRYSVLTLGYGRVRLLDWRRQGSDAGHRRVPAGGSCKCHYVYHKQDLSFSKANIKSSHVLTV